MKKDDLKGGANHGPFFSFNKPALLIDLAFKQCCESGSGWIRKFLLDPVFFVLDPEPGKKKNQNFISFSFNRTENTVECSFKVITVG